MSYCWIILLLIIIAIIIIPCILYAFDIVTTNMF